MTKKIRLTRTLVKEYIPNPDYYPEGVSIEQMAQLDAETDDPELTFEGCQSDIIEWEIVDD